MQTIKKPYVSIIVPTFRDWKRLKLCVEALAGQSYPQDHFEVIIANNDPDDPQPDGFVLPSNFTLINVAKPGSYAARNAGIRLAKGEIIGFTDSDCIPIKDWIHNAVSHFLANPSCKRIAGHIAIFYKKQVPTAAELYNSLYSFPQKMHVQKSGTSVTGNLFVYKKVFDEVGLFDEKQLSLGDLLWGRMAQRAGNTIHYVSDVRVKHPARDFRQLVIKEKRVGGGKATRERGSKKVMQNMLQLLNGCRPRIAEIKFVFRNGRELDFRQKCKVLFIRHFLLNVRTYEQIRVIMGKEPNRA